MVTRNVCFPPDSGRFHCAVHQSASNGMDSSSLSRHLGARLELLMTSRKEEGVHDGDYSYWR
jgi:hypothetical protein